MLHLARNWKWPWKIQGFPGGQWVKNLPAMQMQVRSPGQEDPLEEVMATHSILVWWITMDRVAWRATVHGARKGQTWLKWLSMHACWRTQRTWVNEILQKCRGNNHKIVHSLSISHWYALIKVIRNSALKNALKRRLGFARRLGTREFWTPLVFYCVCHMWVV